MRYLQTRHDLGIGTGNDAFLPEHGLPLYATRGPGTLIMRGFRVMQNRQVYYEQAATLQGMAGIPAGTMLMSPLSTQEEENAYLAAVGNG